MTLRIQPLDAPFTPAGGSGLRIQPLGDFLATLPAWSGAAPSFEDPSQILEFLRANRTSPETGSAGDGAGVNSAGVGFSGPEIANQFGHLAGPSPLSAALTAHMPSISTPAGVLSSLFGALGFVAPNPTAAVGRLAQGIQQHMINEAAQRFGLVHNEQDISSLGFSQPSPYGYTGTSGTNANYSGQFTSVPNGFTMALTGLGPQQSLGLFSSGARGASSDDPTAPDGGNGPAGPGSASGPGGSAGAPSGGGDSGNP